MEYDKSSKWLIQHHGNSLLRLGGLRDPFSWRPLQAEVVQPRRLPDGLLEVKFPNQAEPELFVLEIATHPERRLGEQVLRDLALVYLDRGVLPEALVLILHPKGNTRTVDALELHSRLGWTRWQADWHIVELWTVPAEELFAANDVGLISWVPLTDFGGPPETVLEQCRERIHRQATPEERSNLLAVTQVLTRLRYNDPELLMILGGYQAMIESPLIQELLERRGQEVKHQSILRVLVARFGPVPENVMTALRTVHNEQKLDALLDFAALCPDLETFRQRMQL